MRTQPYGLVFMLLMATSLRAQTPDRLREINLDSVEVVAVGTIPGTTLNRQRVAQHVQMARAGQIERSQSLDLTDFMNRNLGSIHLNTPGGNPLQPDLSFRGFQASPLLGTPQGIAVYQDGVRVNELFGDIVNWDMVPKSAVAGLTFSSGSNPMFGLNALGGALALQMKSGFSARRSDDKLRLSGYGGSFGRFNAEVSSGGLLGRATAGRPSQWAYFVAGQHFRETGWRDHSPSRVTLLYGKLSRQGRRSSFDLSFTGGRSSLLGNGPLPDEALASQPGAVFTHPDRTDNRLSLLAAQYRYTLRKDVRLTVLTYAKRKNTATLNGDLSEYETTPDGYVAVEEAGEEDDDDDEDHRVRDQHGALVKATPDVTSGVNNYTDSRQRSYGTSVQLSVDRPLVGRENHFTAGLSYDGGHVKFTSATELGRLTESRGTVGSGLYDRSSNVDVHINVQHRSVYVQESVQPTEKLTVSLAGRLNESTVVLLDQIDDDLNGNHRFRRFNPAAGVVYAMSKQLNAYVSYALSTRTPTPVELTCADPAAPCKLPNSFLSDPPLKQVVARTWEAGLRAQYRTWDWSAGVFRTRLRDDIRFVSAGPSRNSGYFTNIGSTQRQGIEALLSKRRGRWRGLVSYTYQRATFREELILSSPHHPLAEEGEIRVEPGNRLPLTPTHLLKANLEGDVFNRLTVGADWVLNGAQFLRGDEGNALSPLPAYSVVGLRGQWTLANRWTLFGRVTNVLNTTYRSFGLLGPAQNLPGLPATDSPRWLTPGLPRMFQAGLTWRL